VVCLILLRINNMKNLENYLEESVEDKAFASVILSLMDGIRQISAAVRLESGGKADTVNASGEQQIVLDVLTDQLLTDRLRQNPNVGVVASEEKEGEERLSDVGKFACAYDPLDGSSLADVNLSVGTIIGVYKADGFLGLTGDDQVASLIAVYGPRTTVLLTVRQGVKQFILRENGEFLLIRNDLKVGPGKMFAPGNLRACAFREDYLELTNFWIKEQYKLRYSGGMVPDVNQIILKGMGIFSYPGYGDEPNGKLRLLFECAPIALIMEEVGGAASNGKERILDIKIEDYHQRTPIYIGSKEEVERCNKFLS
jgi:fructose-1,6-bisphosphatase I